MLEIVLAPHEGNASTRATDVFVGFSRPLTKLTGGALWGPYYRRSELTDELNPAAQPPSGGVGLILKMRSGNYSLDYAEAEFGFSLSRYRPFLETYKIASIL